MNPVLLLHIAAFGFWMGVLAVELIIERQRGKSREQGYAIASYYYHIDRFAELPAITVLLVTGLWMLDPSRLSGLYLTKVVAGAVAIGVNYWCFVPVLLRRAAATEGRHADVLRYSTMIDRTLPIGGPFLLIALGLGLFGI